ncbi:MAG: hypothetical protein QM570_04875 [Planctomycetota bacterium]|nr:hypothetical protein [Planctomycetota bacterium]
MRTLLAGILVALVFAGCGKKSGGGDRRVSELNEIVKKVKSENAVLAEERLQLRKENERLNREYNRLKSEYDQLKREHEYLKKVYNPSKAIQGPDPNRSSGIYEEVFR